MIGYKGLQGDKMPFPKGDKATAEKAKRPRPGIPFDSNVIAELIRKHRGNVSKVADSIGSSRGAVRNHIDGKPELIELLRQERERWIDDIELSVLTRADESNDTALQAFVLKTQGRHRGWDQSEAQHTAKDIAAAAFDFILNQSKNPAERKD
jgi:hypothetical protein